MVNLPSRYKTVDVDTLRKLLRSEPDTGKLFWRERPPEFFKSKRDWRAWNTLYANKEAFTSIAFGYPSGKLFKNSYRAHRVLWALHYGCWPAGEIDHINGNRADNRIVNLREASRSENMRNKRPAVGSTSSYLGVHWATRDKKWIASLRDSTGKYHRRYCKSEKEAAMVYDQFARKLHGEFANLNFPSAVKSKSLALM